MEKQPIIDIASICVKLNVTQVILSPGSRSALLSIAFSRHPKIVARVVNDERSAAFIALGMARQSKEMVALVCTSGSAGYNYAPAVAEAFYQQIPLLVFTADRPEEWIDQLDGQTIRQRALYGNHVKSSYHLPQDYSHPDARWHLSRIIQEAIWLGKSGPQGPVHINVPIREPFYPENNEDIKFSSDYEVVDFEFPELIITDANLNNWRDSLSKFKRVMIVAGQSEPDHELVVALDSFSRKWQTPVIADVISNMQKVENSIIHQDLFLNAKIPREMEPDLVISFGLSVISKNLKLFLRSLENTKFWHVQSSGIVARPFQKLHQVIRISPKLFFGQLSSETVVGSQQVFLKHWQDLDAKTDNLLNASLNGDSHHEMSAVNKVMNVLPEGSILHLANSMPVRYANFVGLGRKNIEVSANRGTSGIDGCTSTALGASLVTGKLVVLLTGDVAFFYDRNAFWNRHFSSNLKIILFNNHGGGIFGMIPGPDRMQEFESCFIGDQPLTAEHLCREFGLEYLSYNGNGDLGNLLEKFLLPGESASVLEIETDRIKNKEILTELKNKIKEYDTIT